MEAQRRTLSPPRLRLLLFAATRVDRISWLVPLLQKMYLNECTARVSQIESMHILVHSKSLAECLSLCQTVLCRCAVAVRPETQHVGIAQLLDGTSDVIFAHADMWLNISAIVGLLTRENAHSSKTAMPFSGLMMRGMPVESACVPLTTMSKCHGRSGNVTCGDRTWHWWMGSQTSCPEAAQRSGLSACCYGWADLLYLPWRAHAAFRALSDVFREVFHEVAIPTMLHGMQQATTRWGPPVPWLQAGFSCAGSCCSNVNGWTRAPISVIDERGTQRGRHRSRDEPRPSLMCAHKVSLPAIRDMYYNMWNQTYLRPRPRAAPVSAAGLLASATSSSSVASKESTIRSADVHDPYPGVLCAS